MPNTDEYITGKTLIPQNRVSLSDMWQGDNLYEYPDFMTTDHVSDILARVMSDMHLAYPGPDTRNTDITDGSIWCLGQNFWSLPSDHTFDDVFDLNLRQFMSERYSDINYLVEDFCINYLDRIPEYVPGVATPGFNIVKSDISETYWHTDGALFRKMPEIDYKKIISITIPIQCDHQSHTEFKMSESETYQLKFTPGNLLIWPGRKLHRFGCQSILSDKYRITYQCHIYDTGVKALIHF